QQEMFDVLQDIAKKKENAKAQRELLEVKESNSLELGKDQSIRGIYINNTADHLFYLINERSSETDYTRGPTYVNETGYLEDPTSPTKVGSSISKSFLYHNNLITDSISSFDTSLLPMIQDLPNYLSDYPERKKIAEENKTKREVTYSGF